MSYPNEVPAAAWYPDPQTPGQVRWWDGTNWTQHVSQPAQSTQPSHEVPQVAEADAAVAEADAAFAAADTSSAQFATVSYIGRHAAGATPAPRQPSTAPRIRPRARVEVPAGSLSFA